MDISELEKRFRIQLPERHRQALLDASDPIYKWTDFLVCSSPHNLSNFADCNERLRTADPSNPWPEFLVAFASNGCGDYWAYDTRQSIPRIIYIDPDRSVAENLSADDLYTFNTFEDWYAHHAKSGA